MNYKNLIYVIAGICYCIVIGGAVYEHTAVWPRAYAAPPASLTMLQGQYGLNAALFWQVIHPVNLFLLSCCLFLFWKTARQKNILTILIGYVLILIITFSWFIPELIAITTMPFSETVDTTLVKRGATWEILSIARLCVLLVLGAIYLMGLTKPVSLESIKTNTAAALPALG